MKEFIRKQVRKFFNWIFREKMNELEVQIAYAKLESHKAKVLSEEIRSILRKIDVSVDVHEMHAPSWAVISVQGKKADYIKFIDLGSADIRNIQSFLRQFEKTANVNVDASPTASGYLRILK